MGIKDKQTVCREFKHKTKSLWVLKTNKEFGESSNTKPRVHREVKEKS